VCVCVCVCVCVYLGRKKEFEVIHWNFAMIFIEWRAKGLPKLRINERGQMDRMLGET
jgi:hypothetical protein